MDRVVIGQNANTEVGSGLFVSTPGVNVSDPVVAVSGNLSFDSSNYMQGTVHVIQQGSFSLTCKREEIPAYTPCGKNFIETAGVEIDIDLKNQDGSIPEIAIWYAVGDSSGNYHPWYSSVTYDESLSGNGYCETDITAHDSRTLVHMDSAHFRGKWKKQGKDSIGLYAIASMPFSNGDPKFSLSGNVATDPGGGRTDIAGIIDFTTQAIFDAPLTEAQIGHKFYEGNYDRYIGPDNSYAPGGANAPDKNPNDIFSQNIGLTGVLYFVDDKKLIVNAFMSSSHIPADHVSEEAWAITSMQRASGFKGSHNHNLIPIGQDGQQGTKFVDPLHLFVPGKGKDTFFNEYSDNRLHYNWSHPPNYNWNLLYKYYGTYRSDASYMSTAGNVDGPYGSVYFDPTNGHPVMEYGPSFMMNKHLSNEFIDWANNPSTSGLLRFNPLDPTSAPLRPLSTTPTSHNITGIYKNVEPPLAKIDDNLGAMVLYGSNGWGVQGGSKALEAARRFAPGGAHGFGPSLGGAGSSEALLGDDGWDTYYCKYLIYRTGLGPSPYAVSDDPTLHSSSANIPAGGAMKSGTSMEFWDPGYNAKGLAPSIINNFVFPDDLVGTVNDPATDPFFGKRDAAGRIYGNIHFNLELPEGSNYGSDKFSIINDKPLPVITLDFSEDKWNFENNTNISLAIKNSARLVGGGGSGGFGGRRTITVSKAGDVSDAGPGGGGGGGGGGTGRNFYEATPSTYYGYEMVGSKGKGWGQDYLEINPDVLGKDGTTGSGFNLAGVGGDAALQLVSANILDLSYFGNGTDGGDIFEVIHPPHIQPLISITNSNTGVIISGGGGGAGGYEIDGGDGGDYGAHGQGTSGPIAYTGGNPGYILRASTDAYTKSVLITNINNGIIMGRNPQIPSHDTSNTSGGIAGGWMLTGNNTSDSSLPSTAFYR